MLLMMALVCFAQGLARAPYAHNIRASQQWRIGEDAQGRSVYYRTSSSVEPFHRRLVIAASGPAVNNSAHNSSGNSSADGAHGAHAHGAHPSIFALGLHLDLYHATLCFCVLILFTVCLELFVHKIEHYLHHQAAPHFTEIFDKVIKGNLLKPHTSGIILLPPELMILGVISFIIFIGEQAFALNQQAYYLALEFTHVTIFFTAIVFVIQVLYLLGIVKCVKNRTTKCHAFVTALM